MKLDHAGPNGWCMDSWLYSRELGSQRGFCTKDNLCNFPFKMMALAAS